MDTLSPEQAFEQSALMDTWLMAGVLEPDDS